MYGSSANGEARNSANNGSISARTSMPPSVGAKKMVIKPFKVQPKVPENFGLETWETLKAAVNAVYSKSASFISKEELYRAVENLCIHKMAPKIYELLFIECEINIKAKVYSLVDQSSDHKIFLSVVDEVWRDHCEQLNTVRNIFLHLDRSYALTNPGVKLIWEMGNDIFRRFLETAGGDIQSKIVTGLLSAIELRRLGQSLDSEVIGRLTRMLITLDMYALKFEQPFLLDSRRFFSAEGSHLISSVDTSRFLVLVDKRLHESSEMVKQYLDLGTKKALFEVVESSLLQPHVHTLIEKGLKQLLDDNRKDDLKRMFLLYERVDSLELLKQGWVSYIRSVGDSLMADAAGQKSFVEEVLDFQERMEAVLRQSFFAQESFKLAMQRSFEHFLNNKPNNNATTINSGIQAHFPSAPSVVASELIAKFLDRKMRGEKGVSESDIEALLDKVMSLFRYLQEKDVFEAFYKKYLAKRLLLGKSSSYDLEKSMLAKLKTECGSNFTAKLEGMFQDVELSRECQSAFMAYCSSGNSGGRESVSGSQMELAVQVLTTGYWPQSPLTETLVLPTEFSQLQSKFSAFYVNKYQGRRLSFAHSLERCVVAARFPKGKKDLEVSLFQAIVLVCFNKSEQLSFATLRAQTGIDEEELKRTLQSLACGLVGTRVLTKEPRGKDVDVARDVFAVNAEFTNKLFRIKINTIQMKETIEEVQKTHEEVFRDREYQVDAVIVRTMKSRKRLSHALLMSELMIQLRFPAQSSDLKKRIESLIERDYLERDKDDSTFYNYLA